ncbi:hypothetical protein Glove_40g54 [Diversispora epigaea]|uniref:F-box domain-containing protein n=1 Tax=Diversispora epigaea TaxID=1348612 RepID=A0A397JQH7_9GLOM|nr:hypothetical protein Glove_40g54 [Diversispora epigaea]
MSSKFPNELVLKVLQELFKISSIKHMKKLQRTCKLWNGLIPVVVKDEIIKYHSEWSLWIGWKNAVNLGFYVKTISYKPTHILLQFNNNPIIHESSEINFVLCMNKKLFKLFKVKAGKLNMKKQGTQSITDEYGGCILVDVLENWNLRVVHWKMKEEIFLNAFDKIRCRELKLVDSNNNNNDNNHSNNHESI